MQTREGPFARPRFRGDSRSTCKIHLVHVIAGFESQIAAHGAALAVSGAAGARGAAISGAAIARRDSASGMHIDPLPGFDPPPHILAALDMALESEPPVDVLRPGQTALVVASACRVDVFASVVDAAALHQHGALWSTIVAFDRRRGAHGLVARSGPSPPGNGLKP